MLENLNKLSNLNMVKDSSELNRNFLLMNKDISIAYLVVEGEGDLQNIEIVEVYKEVPEWLKPIEGFIIGRQAPKGREHIQELLEMSGCDNLLGYISITHALSLIDTYWVKPVNSSLSWRDVSLYDKPFNEVIARTAFEGGLHGDQLSSTSPEYGTDGTFAKCWIRENEQIKLLKRGTEGFRNSGMEPYSEFYSSQIAEVLDVNHIKYDLRTHHNKLCSVCDIFTSEKEGYLPYSAIEKLRSTLATIVKMYEKYGYQEQALDMFVFDAVIFNSDRHKGNFGFIVDNDTQEILRPAPLFDHNLSLVCCALQEDFSRDSYISQLSPRIGSTFIKDGRTCLTPKMRRKLINMKGFKFTKHPKYNLPDWRIEKLEYLVNRQIELILKS